MTRVRPRASSSPDVAGSTRSGSVGARRLAPVALLAALALAGCGSSSSGDTASTASSPSPSSAASPQASAAAQQCPLTPTPIPAPKGVGTDLRKKPVVPPDAGTPPTVVQAADIVVGTGPEAVTGSNVTVKYVGAIDKTGKQFDASWDRAAPQDVLAFTACGQQVVPGFSIAPLGMHVGGRRLVRIPDQYGYPGGNPQAGIAAGDVITFVIDLVSVG